MLVSFILIFIWALLMVRSAMAEYKYYQSVKSFEPEIWESLGSPTFFKMPFVFVSSNGAKQLRKVQSPAVVKLAKSHRAAGIQFLAYVVLVLVVGIAYFKMA